MAVESLIFIAVSVMTFHSMFADICSFQEYFTSLKNKIISEEDFKKNILKEEQERKEIEQTKRAKDFKDFLLNEGVLFQGTKKLLATTTFSAEHYQFIKGLYDLRAKRFFEDHRYVKLSAQELIASIESGLKIYRAKEYYFLEYCEEDLKEMSQKMKAEGVHMEWWTGIYSPLDERSLWKDSLSSLPIFYFFDDKDKLTLPPLNEMCEYHSYDENAIYYLKADRIYIYVTLEDLFVLKAYLKAKKEEALNQKIAKNEFKEGYRILAEKISSHIE